MKKFLHKIGAVSTALLCLITSACQKASTEEGGKGKVEVWTAYGTEKILRDLDYSSRYNDDTLTINAFRNEYESAQIIISPEKAVGEYTLSLSDLKNEDGETLSKDAFTVYNQKYINVTDIKDAESQTGAGYYPDALLPYDVAVSYGENKVTDGKNQGLWITLKASKDQPAGVYQGSFRLTVDGEVFQVPVSVTVFDYTLSDEVHSKSSFLVNAYELALGELDSTAEMIESYHDFFLDHRVSPNHLPSNDLYGVLEGKELENFVDAAQKASEDVRCSNYHITYAMSSENIVVNGKQVSIQTVDYALFENTLKAMLERSMQSGVNLFKKAATYFVFFDEYDANKKADSANYNLKRSAELCESLANEYRNSYPDVDEAFRNEVLDSLAKIRHKCVGSLTDNLTSKATMVPTIDKYHTADGRKLYSEWAERWYGDDAELWTYTCMNPDPPYPTYHTEDVLISSRLMGWMMYNYNITGNLYWSTTLYAFSNGYVTGGQIQDYYDTALRFPQANGDGYLVYPGRPYGIKGPVGTVRLQSIRDGNEDYDLLYQLENEFYKTRGVSGEGFDNVLKYLVQDLYNGTRCNTAQDICSVFTQARARLASMITLADKAGVVIENAVTASGKTTFTMSAPADVTIKVNGNALTDGVESDGVIRYEYTVSLDQEVNALNLTATKDGEEYSVSLSLGGKMVETQFADMDDKVTLRTETAKKETVQIDGVNAIKITDAGAEVSVQFDAKSLNVNEKMKSVTLRIYADKQTSLSVRGKCEKHSAYVKVLDVQLEEGWNEVVIDVYTLNSAKNGMLEGVRFNFNSEAGVSVALGTISLVGGK